MIDWNVAERIAAGVAGTPSGGTVLAGDLAAVSADARERVVAYTGLVPARAIPEPEAVDRREWLRLNLRSMRRMMQPLEEKLRAGGDSPITAPLRMAGGLLVGAEVGGLVGYLSQRVLGQYELVLLDHVHRVRAIGAIAVSLCQVALTRVDGMATLWKTRSVDAAAAQLIVRESGGYVAFPGCETPLASPLDLEPNGPIVAARTQQDLDRLAEVVA